MITTAGRRVRIAAAGVAPFPAAVQAISDVGALLVERIERAAERRAVIATSPELQEHDRTKRAAVRAAIDAALRRRGVAAREAALLAQLAVVVFERAIEDWIAADGRRTFPECARAVASMVRHAVADPDGAAAHGASGDRPR